MENPARGVPGSSQLPVEFQALFPAAPGAALSGRVTLGDIPGCPQVSPPEVASASPRLCPRGSALAAGGERGRGTGRAPAAPEPSPDGDSSQIQRISASPDRGTIAAHPWESRTEGDAATTALRLWAPDNCKLFIIKHDDLESGPCCSQGMISVLQDAAKTLLFLPQSNWKTGSVHIPVLLLWTIFNALGSDKFRDLFLVCVP